MSKQKFSEASTTIDIKGCLATGKPPCGKKSKKGKKQEKPWYFSRNSEIEEMVRRDLCERKNISEAPQHKTNDKIDSLRDELRGIKEKLKNDPENNNLRKSYKLVASLIQDEFFKLNPPSVGTPRVVDRSAFGSSTREKSTEPRQKDEVPKQKEDPESADPEKHIGDLTKQLSIAKADFRKDPGDSGFQRKVRFLEKEIERTRKAVELGGEKWREYLIDPELTAKSKQKKNISAMERGVRELRKSDSPYISVAADIVKKFDSDPEAWKGVENTRVLLSSIKLLKKLLGTIPSTEIEHGRIEKWLEGTVIDKFNGDLKAYAASSEKVRKPVQWSKWMKKPEREKGASFPSPEPMPGAISDLYSLHRELVKTPQHKESPFAPPSSRGKGLTADVGSGGRILKNVYAKLIKGIIDDPEYLEKVDPEALGIKRSEFTKFEKALGPFLRNLYKKAGYSVPDWEGEPETEKATASLEPSFGFISSPTNPEKTEEKYKKAMAPLSAVKKFLSRKKASGAEDFDEPRDPEELALRRGKEAEFRRAAQMQREKLPVKQPKFGDLEKSRKAAEKEMEKGSEQGAEEDKKKRELIDLITKKRSEGMPKESFNISELFEQFENSYELDSETKEEEWESATTPAKKDWKKDLSLESLIRKIVKEQGEIELAHPARSTLSSRQQQQAMSGHKQVDLAITKLLRVAPTVDQRGANVWSGVVPNTNVQFEVRKYRGDKVEFDNTDPQLIFTLSSGGGRQFLTTLSNLPNELQKQSGMGKK